MASLLSRRVIPLSNHVVSRTMSSTVSSVYAEQRSYANPFQRFKQSM